jgi:hypothetical protein
VHPFPRSRRLTHSHSKSVRHAMKGTADKARHINPPITERPGGGLMPLVCSGAGWDSCAGWLDRDYRGRQPLRDKNPGLLVRTVPRRKFWEVGVPPKGIRASRRPFKPLQENRYLPHEDLPPKAKDGPLIQMEFRSNVHPVRQEKLARCNIPDITHHKRTIITSQENQ